MRKLRLLFVLLLCAVVNATWGATATLTNAKIVAAGNGGDGYGNYTMTDDNSKSWKAYAIKKAHSNATSDKHYLQIKKYSSSTAYYIQVPEYGSKITQISITVSGTSAAMTSGGNTATLYFSANKNTSTTGDGVASGTGDKKVTINTSDLNLNSGYITASAGVRIWEVTLTYEDAPAFEITAESNNTSLGTVSLSGSKITGSPAANCRYASPAYTVTEGSATVSQSGNEFTVTPSTNCTVRINFEAIPTHTLSYAVSPAGAGSVELSGTSVYEGATATATASANANFRFSGWSITGEGASLSSDSDNPTTVTMGTADATVTANFEAVTTYEIKYSVNGTIVKTVNVEEDAAVDLSAPATGVPAGYVFKGWVVAANKIDTPTDTDPSANYVTSATSTANITYYAVMAGEIPGAKTQVVDKLTRATTGVSSGTTSYSSWSNKTVSSSAVYAGNSAGSNNAIQLRSTDNSGVISTKSGGKVKKVVVEWQSNTVADRTLDIYGKNTAYTATSNLYSTTGSTQGTLLGSIVNGTSTELEIEGDYTYIGFRSNKNAMYLTSVSITWENQAPSTYSNYCTTIPTATVSINAACNDGEGNYYGTYSNAKAFVVPGDITVYEVSVIGGELLLEKYQEGDIVPANTGVLVASDVAGAHQVSLTAGGSSVLGDANMLRPSGVTKEAMASADAGASYFRLTMHNGSQLGFWWGADSGAAFDYAETGKAYLAVPADALADAKVSGFVFGGETTGINTLDSRPSTLDKTQPMYNLAGQRVGKGYKGIVIVNGKKVVKM